MGGGVEKEIGQVGGGGPPVGAGQSFFFVTPPVSGGRGTRSDLKGNGTSNAQDLALYPVLLL